MRRGLTTAAGSAGMVLTGRPVGELRQAYADLAAQP